MRLPLGDVGVGRQLSARCSAGVSAAVCAALLHLSPLHTPAFADAPPQLEQPPPAAASVAAAAATAGSTVADEVWQLLDKYYLDRTFNGVDWRAAHERILAEQMSEARALDVAEKLVKSLGDRYSRLLSPTQAPKLNKYDVTGVGINLVISDAGKMLVGAVPPAGSDAARFGIGFGDEVVSINGCPTAGMTSFDALEAVQLNRESVQMRVRPPGSTDEPRLVTMRREFVTRDPVRWRLVDGGNGDKIGYIKLSEFNSQSKPRMREALTALTAGGASSLILDMRGNGGGVLEGAIGIAGLFVEKPLVLYVTDANSSKQPLYSREPRVEARPLQVWVDGGTASSSEVLAAALQDNCRARVVGAKTYGKGVIQGVFGLSDGAALIETVASYATPSGNEIDGRGVTPDESRTFVSDVLGSSFVDADVKAARFENLACAERLARASPTPDAAANARSAFPTAS